MFITGNYVYKSAITLTPEIMIELDTLFQKNFKNISYTAIIKNESDIRFENLDELLSYKNALSQKITRIFIWGSGSDLKGFIRPIFSGFFNFSSTVDIKYTFTNTDDENSFSNKLNDIFDNAKSPYAFAYKITFIQMALSILAIVSGWLGILILSGKVIGDIKISDLALSSFLWGFSGVFLSWVCSKFWSYFFPPIVYLWGNEKELHKRKTSLRANIFWVIFVGVLISVTMKLILG